MFSRPQLASRRRTLGHSQQSLAALLQVRPQTVARWERGVTTPLPRHRRRLAALLDVTPTRLEQLIADGDMEPAPSERVTSPSVDHCTSLEQGAARLQMFEPIALPDLLQTEDYARAVLRSGHLALDESAIEHQLRIVLARQAILERAPEPFELVAVIDESVLHRVTGGIDVMAAQLKHLSVLADRPSITIQVVPGDSGVLHCAASGPYRLFTAPGSDVPFMVCTQDLTGFRYIDRASEIEANTQLFEHLRTIALSPAESAHILHSTAEQYNDQ